MVPLRRLREQADKTGLLMSHCRRLCDAEVTRKGRNGNVRAFLHFICKKCPFPAQTRTTCRALSRTTHRDQYMHKLLPSLEREESGAPAPSSRVLGQTLLMSAAGVFVGSRGLKRQRRATRTKRRQRRNVCVLLCCCGNIRRDAAGKVTQLEFARRTS